MSTDIQAVLNQLGDPAELARRELQRFGRSARVLTTQYPRLIAHYPNEWIALYDGAVRAHGGSYQAVLDQVDRAGLPREHVMIQFIDTSPRSMIL